MSEKNTTPLHELTLDELDQRYSQLVQRFATARRMQMDSSVVNQLDYLISAINDEKERRGSVDNHGRGVVLDTDPIVIPESKYKRK